MVAASLWSKVTDTIRFKQVGQRIETSRVEEVQIVTRPLPPPAKKAPKHLCLNRLAR